MELLLPKDGTRSIPTAPVLPQVQSAYEQHKLGKGIHKHLARK